jgi:hypothetical protein
LQHRFSQEETPKIPGIILTVISFPADAEIHNPVMAGFVDVMFYNLGRDDSGSGTIQLFMDLNGVILGKNEHLISPEKQVVNKIAYQGQPGKFSKGVPGRVNVFQEIDEPDRSAHVMDLPLLIFVI